MKYSMWMIGKKEPPSLVDQEGWLLYYISE
jgi:hypothetical protein